MVQPTSSPPVVSGFRNCTGLRLRELHGDSPPNALLQGDNLMLMEALLAEYADTIDLIYVDPPFDVGTDFKMDYSVSTVKNTDPIKIEVTAYRDRWGEGPDSYLAQMKQRLTLMHQLLSDRGALWVHCDYRVNHHLRLMLDEIFGQPCVNEIIWAYGAGGNPSHSFPHKHDYLLVYSKSGRILINKDEPIMRVPYDLSTLTTHYRSVDKDGRHFRSQKKNDKEYITYADQGKLITDVWTDIGGQNATSPISQESTGYASQKPEKLLERIIAGTTSPDYLIADFFCGSGTTGAVASRLGRRWIMADFGEQAIHTTRKRLLQQEPPCGFSIYDLSTAETNTWWSKAKPESDQSYEAAVLAAFAADPDTLTANIFVEGKPRDTICLVAPIETTVDRVYVDAALPRLRPHHKEPVLILAWRFDPDLAEAAALGTLPEMLSLVPIPRSLMEVGRPDPPVWQALPRLLLSANSETKNNRSSITITIENYSPRIRRMAAGNAAEIIAASENDGRAFVDLLAIDSNSDLNQPFSYEHFVLGSRRDKKGVTELIFEPAGKPPKDSVRVRVVDIFGTITTVRLRIPPTV